MAQNLLASPAPQQPTNSSSTANNNNNNVSQNNATTTATNSPLSTGKQPQSPNQQRIAVLRVKRQELEKRLQEKNSLLQELCRKEAHLIGVYPTVTVAGQEGHHNHHPSSSADDIGNLLLHGGSSGGGGGNGSGSGKTQHSTHSLPRKIGTGFTLSEKYLNKRTPSANSPLNAPKDDEELNSLLLQRDIQQQICKASLKLLNDVALTKSVRRKHKQSYEVAQQKLMDIGKGLTVIQKKRQNVHQQQHDLENHTSQTLPLSNFKVPQNYSIAAGESPTLERNMRQQQKRNRHDSYSNANHSPVTSHGYAVTGASSTGEQGNKGLYRSSSNSSSLNNAHVLGKSSLSLDNGQPYPLLHQQQQTHPHQSFGGDGGAQPLQSSSSHNHHHHGKPTSYESKSLHNFVMSSPNHTSTSAYQMPAGATTALSSPHHHPALLSPTFYNAQRLHHHQSFATTSRTTTTPTSHYPSNSAGLRQSHQQQQFMSPPPQQVVIPQSGLGGYWTLNENNERVWCSSGSGYSPEPSGSGSVGGGGGPPQRYAGTLDRKAAIYVPSTSSSAASHGKLKMPSPEASPTAPTSTTSGGAAGHHNQREQLLHNQQQQQPHPGYGLQDGGTSNNNSGKSFSIPNKSTSLGNIEFLHVTRAEDTTSLGSYNSDTNNNPSVYQHLVSAMAATKVSHFPNVGDDQQHSQELHRLARHHHEDIDENHLFMQHQQHDSNNNGQLNAPPPPRPMRPKSSASQHAPEKSWYETSLDKVVPSGSSKMATAAKAVHKPPALLPREIMTQQPPQLHIEIPTSPISSHSSSHLHHNNPHQQLERSMSHRVAGSNFSAGVSPTSQPPPIMRQNHHHQQPQQLDEINLSSPRSPHKKLTSTSSGGGSSMNAVRRSQSNVLIMGTQQQQQHSTSSAALLSPQLVNGQQAMVSPAIQKVIATEGGEEGGAAIQVESPKNMTVVQQGKFQPYKEESKPFEMSDFYKYSTKFRQNPQHGSGVGGGVSTTNRNSSRNAEENGGGGGGGHRGNVLYQQEQQQRGYLADVANNNSNNNNNISNHRGSSNNHNNTNAQHILQSTKSGSAGGGGGSSNNNNVTLYG